MDITQLSRQQFQQEMDTDAMFISVPESSAPQYASAKLCTPHNPGLYASQPGTPPQLVPDSAVWPSPQPCWSTPQGLQGGPAGLEEAVTDLTPWLEDFQGLQVCQGEPDLLHESQAVPQVLQGAQVQQGVPQVLQGVPQVQQGVPQVLQGVPQVQQGPLHGLQGVPQVLQESRGMPYLQQVCQDVPQGLRGAPQVGQGEQQESQPSPASQVGSPVGTEGAAGRRRARRAPRPRPTKLYERKEPFEDPQQEKRRRDAINSKKNREASKAKMTELRRRVDTAATLRDNLRREVAALRLREAQLLAQLEGPAPVPLAAAPATTLTAPATTAAPHDHGRPLMATAAPHGHGRPLAVNLPPAATLTGTPEGTAFLPATTAASLPCPVPHLTPATPCLPPTPPSSCMQADAPLITSTPSPCPYISPFTPLPPTRLTNPPPSNGRTSCSNV